ncbi:hypothetical protein NQZ68_024341 [Dissostichus eleginoides]|nr:hypothetical protein NQZ68_024341 [Dissostichus eleginoides]
MALLKRSSCTPCWGHLVGKRHRMRLDGECLLSSYTELQLIHIILPNGTFLFNEQRDPTLSPKIYHQGSAAGLLGFPPPVPPPACARTRCMRPRPRASLLVNSNRVQRRRAGCLDVSRCVPVPVPVPLCQQDLCGPSQREAPPPDRERTPLTP